MDTGIEHQIERLNVLSALIGRKDIQFKCNLTIRFVNDRESDPPYAMTDHRDGIFSDALNKVLYNQRDELISAVCVVVRETILADIQDKVNHLRELGKEVHLPGHIQVD